MEIEPGKAEKDTSVTLGVGDSTGNLFVHGSYEAIDAVRQVMYRNRELFHQTLRLKERIRILEKQLQEDVNAELLRHAARRFKELEERRAEDVLIIARMMTYLEKNKRSEEESPERSDELLALAKARLVADEKDREPPGRLDPSAI